MVSWTSTPGSARTRTGSRRRSPAESRRRHRDAGNSCESHRLLTIRSGLLGSVAVTVQGLQPSLVSPGKAAILFALALAIGAMGIYVGDADDAPGAAVMGLLLMLAAVVLAV